MTRDIGAGWKLDKADEFIGPDGEPYSLRGALSSGMLADVMTARGVSGPDLAAQIGGADWPSEPCVYHWRSGRNCPEPRTDNRRELLRWLRGEGKT